MRLLLITQIVDTSDTYLGFFHRWIEHLAHYFESIEVICLYEGTHALPENVRVHSLGKEKGKRRGLMYALRFFKVLWKLRCSYDAVFVHMNEEYVLLGGFVWRLLSKPVYLWRNHYAGSWRTSVAASLSRKVFYTSAHSYTARYKNSVRMPVGVDTERFEKVADAERTHGSILFLARMAPSKRPELLIDALALLKEKQLPFIATLVGSPLAEDVGYYASLQDKVRADGLSAHIRFLPGIPHAQTPEIFGVHQIFVNASPSGMLDKTHFEAAAAGCAVVSSSADWRDMTSPAQTYFEDSRTLADLLEHMHMHGSAEMVEAGKVISKVHSLHILARRIADECMRK